MAHFLGMHAMQALPLIGLAVERRVAQRHAALIVCVAALAYSAGTLFVFLQALRGLPFIPA